MSKTLTLYNQLETLALKGASFFCCLCHLKAPTGKCDNCESDDLVSASSFFGVNWSIEDMIKEHLKPIDKEKAFEKQMKEHYPINTEIGWLEINTINTLKAVCPCDWNVACDNYIHSLAINEEVISFDNGLTYFWTSEIENFIKENLSREVS